MQLRFFTVSALILLAAFSRIVPHMPNFSPLNAIALFGAAYFTRHTQALIVPLAATWLSDLFLNNVTYAKPGQNFVFFYPGFYWQYLAYALIVVLGRVLFRRGVVLPRVAVGALSAGLVFFLVSNFGVWVSGELYPFTWQGFVACYVAALPFYQGTLQGDVVFSAVLFGGFHVLERYLSALQLSAAADKAGI